MLHTFLATVGRCVLFEMVLLVYVIYILYVPLPSIIWVRNIFILGIPALASFGSCFIINKKSQFNHKNMISKTSVYRLVSKIFAIFCFLLLGYFFNTRLINSAIPLIAYMTNANMYVIVACIVLVYIVTEYLFVESNQDTDLSV